jgi:hypothetical protein
VHTGQSGEL